MADLYIDPFETQIYGKFTREQCVEVCLGRIPGLDPTIQFVIDTQQKADDTMAEIIARQPVDKAVDAAAVLQEASDIIGRFGRHLESHRRGTINMALFFRGDVPSVLARRRLTKLSAGVQHIVSTLIEHQAVVREAAHWLSELTPVRDDLQALERQQRAAKVRRVDLGPEVEAGRRAWLAIYVANKQLIRGFLAHLGKPELLSSIFDDLAEVHRVAGTSDEMPTGVEPDADPGAAAGEPEPRQA